jgi:hypothetical protein
MTDASSVRFVLRQLELGEDANDTCALCGFERLQSNAFLEGIANDGVNDVPFRRRLASRGGFCGRHTEAFKRGTHVLSAAILLEAVLSARLAGAARGARPTVVRCEACDVERRASDALVDGLKRARRSDDVVARLERTPLCLHHLERVGRVVPPVRRALTERHAALLGRLRELVRKHDYRFTGEAIEPAEARSIGEALRLFGIDERDEPGGG